MQAKLKTYLVGGAVRDRLLGIDVKDRDFVVVGSTPEQMKTLGYQQVGADFPVFLHPTTHEEYALARTERKTGSGYHGFSVDFSADVTLEEDLRRRDLTINAMAEDDDGSLIDPYGGQHDLGEKKLRHVSEAFREDPVRILRTARFAARFNDLGFTVAADTLELMTDMVTSGEAGHLVPQRVWQEWQNALLGKNPQVFIQVLRHCGAYRIIAPELDRCYLNDNDFCSGKRGEGALKIASTLSPIGEIRLAALLCASLADEAFSPSETRQLIDDFCRRLTVPKSWYQLASLVAQHHQHCHQALTLTAPELLALLEQSDAFRRPERFEHFLTACAADYQSRCSADDTDTGYPQAALLQKAYSATKAIEVKPLIEQGLRGPAIKLALHEQRLQALSQV